LKQGKGKGTHTPDSSQLSKAVGSRNNERGAGTACARCLVLERTEPEQLVLNNPAARIPADTVEIEPGPFHLISISARVGFELLESVVKGIEKLVLVIPPHLPMEAVRSGLGDRIELTGGRVTEFRCELIGQNRKLFHSILDRKDLGTGY